MRRLIFATTVALSVLVVGTAITAHVTASSRPHAPAPPAAQPKPAPTSPRKIDEYGNIKFGDEKARLENMAIEMRNDPATKGYLVGYGGRRARVGEARRRIERAKNHLVAFSKIAPERIETIDGGYRENLTVELWVIPAEADAPIAAPTVDPSEVEFIRIKPKRRPRRAGGKR